MSFLGVFLILYSAVNLTCELSYQEKLVRLSYYEPGSDFCYSDKNITLDLLFLADRSSKKVLKAFPKLVVMADELGVQYPESRFAVSYYSDFPCLKWTTVEECKKYNTDGAPHHKEKEGCYTFGTKLTFNAGSLKSFVEDNPMEFLPSGGDEAAAAAMMLAATDRNIGWSTSSLVDENYDRTRIIIVISDTGTNCCRQLDTTMDPKGDGTDRCQDIHNPQIAFVGDVLKKNGITPFLLLTEYGISRWKDDVKELKMTYGVAELEPEKPDITKILKQFNEFILDVRLSKGPVGCADPPAYNTLGY